MPNELYLLQFFSIFVLQMKSRNFEKVEKVGKHIIVNNKVNMYRNTCFILTISCDRHSISLPSLIILYNKYISLNVLGEFFYFYTALSCVEKFGRKLSYITMQYCNFLCVDYSRIVVLGIFEGFFLDSFTFTTRLNCSFLQLSQILFTMVSLLTSS